MSTHSHHMDFHQLYRGALKHTTTCVMENVLVHCTRITISVVLRVVISENCAVIENGQQGY